MDRGAWRAAVRGVTKSRTRLSDFTLLLWLTYNVVFVYGTHQRDPGVHMYVYAFHILSHCHLP